MVSLRPITAANRDAVEALAVTPDQGRFVSGVRESLVEAAQHPDARALYWAIAFYERYGFERTGELHGDEILLRLEIS